MTGNIFYVIDSSSFINLRIYYPRSVFNSLWEKFDGLIYEGRVGAPYEVLEELEQKDDELTKWAKNHDTKLFHNSHSPFLLQQVSIIMGEFPKLIDPGLEREQADPFVIAMGLEQISGPQKGIVQYDDVFVVTEERISKNKSGKVKKTKIPEVCEFFGLPCCSILNMFQTEGWKF